MMASSVLRVVLLVRMLSGALASTELSLAVLFFANIVVQSDGLI